MGAFLALAAPALTRPGTYVYDEIYQAFTAGRYAAGDVDAFRWDRIATCPVRGCAYEWVHPPLGKLIVAASIRALGNGPLGWRLPGLLAGAALVALSCLLAWRCTKSSVIVGLTGLAVALDGLVIVMSRTALPDVWCALFMLAAVTAVTTDRTLRSVTAASAFIGLALATKWLALPLYGIGGVVLVATVRARAGVRAAVRAAVLLLLIPAVIYGLAHVPFLLAGHGLGDLFRLLGAQVSFHAGLRATHAYASSWWSWPLLARPVWFWTAATDLGARNIFALGNPVAWWGGTAAALIGLARAIRARAGSSLALPGIVLLALWLPWAIPDRPAFQYYLLGVVPLLALAWATAVADLARLTPRPWVRAIVIAVNTALLVGVAAWLHPLWTGGDLSLDGLRERQLLPGWR